MTEELFNVVVWFPDDSYELVLRWAPAQQAVEKAHSYISRPAGQIGIIRKVMITDAGDHCNFLWEFGKGVVFPRRKDGSQIGAPAA